MANTMTQAARPPVAPSKPMSRVRFRIVALGTTLAMVTYLDRVSMGTIAPIVTQEWGLTPSETGWIFTAFGLGYAIFEIPTAWWAEKLGTKSVLTRIVFWWSAFTMLTCVYLGGFLAHEEEHGHEHGHAHEPGVIHDSPLPAPPA